MPSKRPPFSFSELEPKGRKAILRTAEEVQAEEALLLAGHTYTSEAEPPTAEGLPQSPMPGSRSVQVTSTPPTSRARRKPNHDSDAVMLDSQHDNDTASALASYPASVIETIRKIVKVPGKDVSFVRLTSGEKDQLVDIVYTYKRQGKKTTENEINRIAVNFILADYKTNGANSILARVIAALLA